ncbi:RICIN domain-containing protein [Solihabitans fulvus]|uniref:RICIN domain-containing protein n=1 Tax=Solihabitans fulvus TaxID=1892852 RepID=A0A5B2XBU8_9PSEU|nr:RICIN domain-containing protein [Solihabitans fulvus]KAA2260655.1 RICIN domain-containing protein [Solihabitans fulvus]
MLRLKTSVAAAVVALATVGALAPPAASASPPDASYTITVGPTSPYKYPTDTPASPFTDKDGRFYFQQSAALYGKNDPRVWDFYTGTDFDAATKSPISDAVNPANPKDRNNDTTWRCNNSPTGKEATDPPAGSGYSQKNFCDLVGVWVDPDTGAWYGLVHNEFTPEPFGARSFSHYDSIDLAVSTNQGRVWTIKSHIITSPYSTKRGDTAAFPNETFYYGDGDPRLFADPASGYFYVYYGSRVVPKVGTPGSTDGLAHVARAPMSQKMAAGSWQKWYDGSWSQPGVGGKESNMEPATAANPSGYTPIGHDYNPANKGTVDQQIAAGTLPSKSELFVMNIAYDAALGLYVGTPEAVDQSAKVSQKYYVTDDLATQRWRYVGDSGDYKSDSWYRWFLDGQNRTNSTVVGGTFRAYCAIACANSDGEYASVTIDATPRVGLPVDPAKTYRIGNGSGRLLAQVSGSTATTSLGAGAGSDLAAWRFDCTSDRVCAIVNVATRQALGVDSRKTANRAWGAKPTVTNAAGPGGYGVGQQWFLIPGRNGAYRLVNRYSGLVLAMSANNKRLVETTPARSWTDTTGNPVGGSRSAAEQTLSLTQINAG